MGLASQAILVKLGMAPMPLLTTLAGYTAAGAFRPDPRGAQVAVERLGWVGHEVEGCTERYTSQLKNNYFTEM